MRYEILLTIAALAAFAAGASAQAADEAVGYQVEDSLEARVWLDRGSEPVVEPGDEVRVYYRTSQDAFAAIFRIDTDGRISLLFPQHPDVDPFVAGNRDYRLIFPDSPRWRVHEDPGVGYFFMVSSRVPLDFSAFGFDAHEGWDLSGIGATVYEDPYVAIDDYVAAVLPTWETTPYALDFLEYSVGEEHDYPRFLCYDCHGYRSYASWNPYDRVCTSYQVVIWDDPYFYPRFRYVGTRVVFARPLYPRPRYAVTRRVLGSARGPIVRSRPAPPRRTAVYKENPRASSTVVPTRSSRVLPGASRVGGTRASPSASRTPADARRVPPSASRGPSGAARVTPDARRAAPSGATRPTPAAGRRNSAPTRPSARLGRSTGRRPTSEAGAGRPAPPTSERPTLQRRTPSARSSRTGPRASSPGARAPSTRARPQARQPVRRPLPASTRSAPRSSAGGSRSSGGASPSRVNSAPSRPRTSGPPTRPRAGSAPRSSGSRPPPPRAGSRRPPGGSGSQARPAGSGGRPAASPRRSGGRPPGGSKPPPRRPGG